MKSEKHSQRYLDILVAYSNANLNFLESYFILFSFNLLISPLHIFSLSLRFSNNITSIYTYYYIIMFTCLFYHII